MRFRVLLALSAAALSLAGTGVAVAQDFPDMPGMGAAERASRREDRAASRSAPRQPRSAQIDTQTPTDPVDIPDLPALPDTVTGATGQQPQTAATPAPARTTTAGSTEDLPNSGAPVSTIALTGLSALLAGLGLIATSRLVRTLRHRLA